MKKLLLALVLMVPMLAFTGCGGGDDEPDMPNSSDKSEITNNNIAGVWEYGDKFVSFTSDGFYCAYLADKYIASGSYSISGDEIKCNNAYYGTELTFDVSSFKADGFQSEVEYVDFEGNSVESNIKFRKSDKTPTPKENILIGKTYVKLVAFNGTNKLTYSFNTFNTAEQSIPKNAKETLTKSMCYIYLAPNFYYQAFKPKTAGLNSFYNDCDKGQVYKGKVTIENGQITDIAD